MGSAVQLPRANCFARAGPTPLPRDGRLSPAVGPWPTFSTALPVKATSGFAGAARSVGRLHRQDTNLSSNLMLDRVDAIGAALHRLPSACAPAHAVPPSLRPYSGWTNQAVHRLPHLNRHLG